MVEAFRKVKANQGGPGVDGCTIEDFGADLRNRLYVTWNRMSSGSYFPPPVKAVEVPKPHGGGTRMLGAWVSNTQSHYRGSESRSAAIRAIAADDLIP